MNIEIPDQLVARLADITRAKNELSEKQYRVRSGLSSTKDNDKYRKLVDERDRNDRLLQTATGDYNRMIAEVWQIVQTKILAASK